MWVLVVPLVFLGAARSFLENDFFDNNEIKIEHYVYWPNGTVPFYINPEHFDHEQSNIILTALTVFAYKTCLKFLPALVAPSGNQHVLVIENPNGVRECVFSTTGHARDEPHYLTLGYDCLKSPDIDTMLMKALGFGFEHNRAIRDLYVTVQNENIDPSSLDLFTKDDKLPFELRTLPYDIHSVTHFSERQFSKNGHRTIIILDHKVKQCREGLSELDLRKIDLVYGPECRKRDRLEKIDLCQGFPGVARKKREVEQFVRDKRELQHEKKSLRVNPNITPPPEVVNTTDKPNKEIDQIIEDLGIKDGMESLTALVFKVAAQALNNTRNKYCNNTDINKDVPTEEAERRSNELALGIFGVLGVATEFIQDMVNHALSNLTEFCQGEGDLVAYQRQRCSWGGSDRCPVIYKSTKHGPVRYSTQHRPYIPQSTKNVGGQHRVILYHQGRRDDTEGTNRDDRDRPEDGGVRKKRDAELATEKEGIERRFERRRYK